MKRKYTHTDASRLFYRLGLIVCLEYGIDLEPYEPLEIGQSQNGPGWMSRADTTGFYISKTAGGVRHEERIKVDVTHFDSDDVIVELRKAIEQLMLLDVSTRRNEKFLHIE